MDHNEQRLFELDEFVTTETILEPKLRKLKCVVCGNSLVQPGDPTTILSDDRPRGAGWPGRGWLVIIPIEGECGHSFEVCLGFHKGDTVIFARPKQLPQGLPRSGA